MGTAKYTRCPLNRGAKGLGLHPQTPTRTVCHEPLTGAETVRIQAPAKHIWTSVLGFFVLCLSFAGAARSPLQVGSWAYQLQNYDQRTLESLGVDLLVVDADELKESGISPAVLKKANKHVVSYLSIGEAEDYRSYWDSSWAVKAPAWLGPENMRWQGNYKVKYWHGQWQRQMHRAIRRLAKAGYDGAYFDLLDAWEYWDRKGVVDAKERMIEFVLSLTRAARRVNPDFLIIAQNAPELASNTAYLTAIDAQAIEDLWFDGDILNSPVDVSWTLNQLEPVIEAQKPVLSVDYVTRFHTVADYCRRGRSHGLVPFTAPRALDAIPTTTHRQCPKRGVRIAGQ